MLEHLLPLLQEPRFTDVALLGLVQFFFVPGGTYGEKASRAGRFYGSMPNRTANKGAGNKGRHSDISEL